VEDDLRINDPLLPESELQQAIRHLPISVAVHIPDSVSLICLSFMENMKNYGEQICKNLLLTNHWADCINIWHYLEIQMYSDEDHTHGCALREHMFI